jgi:hypothetical protein
MPSRERVKKGPKRSAKTTAKHIETAAVRGKFGLKRKTLEELDAEMEEWMASAPAKGA